MAENATNLKTFFEDNYNRAQTRITALADEAKKRIETADNAVRRDLRDQLGLATAARVTELEATVEELKAELEALKKATAKDIAKLKKQLTGAAKSAKSVAKTTAKAAKKTAKKATRKANNGAPAKPAANTNA